MTQTLSSSKAADKEILSSYVRVRLSLNDILLFYRLVL